MKKVKQLLLATGGLAMITTSIVVTASTAFANYGTCYNRNGYSFENWFDDITNGILVWRGNGCNGLPILEGDAQYNQATHQVELKVYDNKSDNTGITLYTHGPSLSSDVHTDKWGISATYNTSSFSQPYDFWVRVGGTTNSDGLKLPIP